MCIRPQQYKQYIWEEVLCVNKTVFSSRKLSDFTIMSTKVEENTRQGEANIFLIFQPIHPQYVYCMSCLHITLKWEFTTQYLLSITEDTTLLSYYTQILHSFFVAYEICYCHTVLGAELFGVNQYFKLLF